MIHLYDIRCKYSGFKITGPNCLYIFPIAHVKNPQRSPDNKQIYVAKYLPYMPTGEELRRELNLEDFKKVDLN